MWTLSGQTVVAVLRILSLVWLARLLTPEEFGLMTAVLVVVDLSAIFVFIGIGPAIVQLPHLTKDHLSTGFITSFLLSLVVQVVIWMGAPLIASFFGALELVPMLRIASFIFPIRGLSIVAISVMRRELLFKDIIRVDVLAYIVGFAPVAIGLALMGAGTWALIIAYIVNATITTTCYLFIRPPRGLLTWRTGALIELLRFGSGSTLARLASYFGSSADNLIVGRLLGIRALGLYGRAYGVMMSVIKISTGMIDKILFPTMAKVQNDPRRLQKGYRDAQTAVVLSILPVSAFLIALAPETIALMLGSQWMEVTPVFQILAAGMLFRAGHRTSLTVVSGTGAIYRTALVQIMYALAVVVGALVGGQRWGIQGVAGGVLIAMFLGYVLAGKSAIDITGLTLSDFFNTHRPGLLVAASVFSLSWFVAQVMRGVDAPAAIIFLTGLVVSSIASYYLARKTVRRLLGNTGLQQIRELFGKSIPPDKAELTIHTGGQ